MRHSARLPGAFINRVENANSNPVAEELGPSLAFERVLDRAVRLARDRTAPDVIDFPVLTCHVEIEPERMFVNPMPEILEHGSDRAPTLVAHGRVNRPNDFVVADANIAQHARSRFEPHRQRT